MMMYDLCTEFLASPLHPWTPGTHHDWWLGDEHRGDDMDDAVGAGNVGGHQLGSIHGDAALGIDGHGGALQGHDAGGAGAGGGGRGRRVRGQRHEAGGGSVGVGGGRVGAGA